MNTLEKYQLEAEEDCKIDLVNIQEKQLLLPSVKHKWVARLINERRKLKRLEESRRQEIDSLSARIKEKSPVAISDVSAQNYATKHSNMQKINEDIEVCRDCIDYLERLEKVFSSTTWDLKNVIEIMKMENM